MVASKLENNFVAIERIKEYCHIEMEAAQVLPGEEEEEEGNEEEKKRKGKTRS